MPEESATDAARRFSDLLDAVEHNGEHFTVVRHGKAVAHIEPISRGRGVDVKALLRDRRPDRSWVGELGELRGLLEIDDRS